PNNLGKSIKEANVDVDAWQRLITTPNTVIETVNAAGDGTLNVAVPVKILPDTTWYAVVSVPKATVVAYLNPMAWISAPIIVGALVMLVLLGSLISLRFRKRIEAIVSATGEIARGNTKTLLADTGRRDELGDMARALTILQDAAIAKQRLEREAEQSRALSD